MTTEKQPTPADPWRPTILMEKISRALEEASTRLTRTGVASIVHCDRPEIRAEALERLIFEGHIVEESLKGSRYLRLVEPFRSEERALNRNHPTRITLELSAEQVDALLRHAIADAIRLFEHEDR